jgi:threonine dehydrogenase-like Zn-dependent dehydrogenase
VPAGALGKAVAKYFGEEPSQQLDHVQRYTRPLLGRIERGEIDPTRVITHRLPLAEAPCGYDIFKHKQDHCEKVVLKP